MNSNHLGGYVPGGDEATYYPALWDWLCDELHIKSVLDVGCGDGVAVKYFGSIFGVEVRGVDGIDQNDPNIIEWDYTKGPVDWAPNANFDLVWSCEFVEHVEEQYAPNFLNSFATGKIVLITHAFPGQSGYHHVNCQPSRYWIDKMKGIDYFLDVDLTVKTRELAAENNSPWNHYKRSGLAFRRNND